MSGVSKTYPVIVLVLLATGAGALVYHQARIEAEFSVSPVASELQEKPASNIAASAIQLRPLALEEYAEIVERPLFSRLRRPPEPELRDSDKPVVEPEEKTASITSSKPKPPLRLVGIALSEQSVIALLAEPNSEKLVRLTTGDMHQGWSVTKVESKSVTLSSGGVEWRLMLDFKSPGD